MVVAQSPPPPVTMRPTTYREPTPPAPPEDLSAAKAFVWVLFGFKAATLGIILWLNPTLFSWVIVAATSWFWLLIPAFLLAGPTLFRWRLLKLRRRRAALRRSEWLIEAGPATAPGRPRRR